MLPPIRRHTRRQTSHAALQQHMGICHLTRGCARFNRLSRNRGIALHHIARHIFIAVIRGIGNHLPAVCLCQTRRFYHRLIVIACNAHNLRTIGTDGGLALLTHVRVQHYHAATATILCRCRQSTAMVAIGGTDDGLLTQGIAIAACKHRRHFPFRMLTHQEAHQGNWCTQGFEAAQA